MIIDALEQLPIGIAILLLSTQMLVIKFNRKQPYKNFEFQRNLKL